MYYLIKEFLAEADYEQIADSQAPYVAVVNNDKFIKRNCFSMGIDMDTEFENPVSTSIVVNYDSLTGSFCIPDRTDIFGKQHRFGFAIDEKGIVLIDNDSYAASIVEKIKSSKKWRTPSLERFIYDFLETIVKDDLHLFEEYDRRLDDMEEKLLANNLDNIMEPLLDIRSEILELHTHYGQLMDVIQELLENENNFFKDENLRYFEMYSNRISRLNDLIIALRERVIQVRDLYHSQLEVQGNKVNTLLTIIATIFMPLTLIAGWYGMNFRYMPELNQKYSYPVLVIICIIISIVNIIYFKKKKWL